MNAGWMALEGLSEARLLVTTRTTDSDRDLRVDADPPEGTEKQSVTVASSSTAAETSSQMTVETVEVAHEELLRRWDTLKAWANKDRRFLQWRSRLTPLLGEYQRDKKGALLRGEALRESKLY